MSPMIARASEKRPPAPMPWTARKAASDGIDHGERAEHRADREDRDGEEEELLAPVDVAELAVERRRDRGGDEVCRRDPGLAGEVVEVVGDDTHGARDDRLVERSEEHPHHEADEDGDDLLVGEHRSRVGACAGGRVRARVDARRFGGGVGHVSPLSASGLWWSRRASGAALHPGPGGWRRARRRARAAGRRTRRRPARPSRSAVPGTTWRGWPGCARAASRPCSVRETTQARPSLGSALFSSRPPATSALTWRLTVETSLCRVVASSEMRTVPAPATTKSTGYAVTSTPSLEARGACAWPRRGASGRAGARGRRRSPRPC